MSTIKFTLIFSLALFVISNLNAQERTLQGKVTTFDEYELNKVSVTAKKSGAETLSNTDGYYTIKCDEKDKLVFEANGFYREKVKLKKVEPGDSVNVNLKLRNGDDNFEVATGYGHIDKDKLTHAIQQVKSDNDFSNYDSVLDIIDDKFTGIRMGGIAPRGRNTFGGGSPLLVVDGSVVQVDFIKNIPTSQVKSINMLKGASASARYGSRGMNGVIVIETKSK